MRAVHTWHSGNIATIGFISIFSEPQNIEQGISNVEVTPFVILRFLVRHSIFNVLGRLQELHKIPLVSCVDKSQFIKEEDFLGF